MAKVISFTNNKGGVGKTTSVSSVGFTLAEAGYKILLVDYDAQCNLTQGVGVAPEEQEHNLFTAMQKGSLAYSFLELTDWVDLLPGAYNLQKVDMVFAAELGREHIFKKLLKKVKSQYDFVLIDCPPAINLSVVNAIVASDYYVVPMHAEFFSVTGIQRIINTITQTKDELDLPIELLGVFLTRFHPNTRKKEIQTAYEAVSQSLGNYFLKDQYIRETSFFSRSQSEGLDIVRYWQNTGQGQNAKEDYRHLTEALLERINQHEYVK